MSRVTVWNRMRQLPDPIANRKPRSPAGARPSQLQPSEKKIALIDALRQSKGNQSQAARLLGVSRVTVWNRMRQHGNDLLKVVSP